GFVAAASPDAIHTLTGSIALLTGEIGAMFLPVIAKASGWIQQARHYIAGLSDETKKSIVWWTLLGLGISGTDFAIAKVVAVGKMLYEWLQALPYLVAKVAAGFSFLIAHPMVAGVLALAAAVGYLAYQMNKSSRETDAMLGRLNEFEHSQSRGEFENSPLF